MPRRRCVEPSPSSGTTSEPFPPGTRGGTRRAKALPNGGGLYDEEEADFFPRAGRIAPRVLGDPRGRDRRQDGRDRERARAGRGQAHARRDRSGRRPDARLAQLRLDARRGLPRDVHAGGLRARRDRLHAGPERGPHDDDELHGLRARHPGVLGVRVRAADGRVGRADGGRADRSGDDEQAHRAVHRRQRLGALRRHGILPVGRLL